MTGKLLVRLFALFGMTLTCVACYGVMYTEFNPEFGASGRVVDDAGVPIEGIEARCGGNVTSTDAEGRFYVMSDSPYIVLTDVDGEANGGEFAKLKLDISDKVTKIEEGDGWNQGSYKADIGDVVLTLKSETNEEVEDKAYRITLSVTVVNEAGEPIQGILVRPESGDFAGREGYTDHLGSITTSSYIESVNGRFVLQFKDVDGEYNLGEYEDIDLDITDRVLAVATEYGTADVTLEPVVMKKK